VPASAESGDAAASDYEFSVRRALEPFGGVEGGVWKALGFPPSMTSVHHEGGRASLAPWRPMDKCVTINLITLMLISRAKMFDHSVVEIY
jgi:hypothetical protein